MIEHAKFRHTCYSYFLVILLGSASGLFTRLTDVLPADNLWGFSSIATLFGFWMVTVTLIVYFSSSNKNAALNAFLYLCSMSFSFYMTQYLLGRYFDRFDNGAFQWSLFALYSTMSLVCGFISYLLYFWNSNHKFSSVLYALPAGGLAAETVGVGIYLFRNHTFLFQFLFDLISFLLIGYWFFHKAAHKSLYVRTVLFTSLLGYLCFYKPFL